uniref:Uncharacterized protein n=1 Tax=Ditylenchus dipsaci TaxID=166011 RepID=A0A915DSN3_9BILA
MAIKKMIGSLELKDVSLPAGGLHSNEYINQSLVVLAGIQARQHRIGVEVSFPTMAKDRSGVVRARADLVMINKKNSSGFITMFTHNEDVSKGLAQSEEYTQIFEPITEVQNIKRVSINVNSKTSQ